MIGGDGCAENDALVENPQITEINARFSFNGLLHQAYGQDSLELMGVGKNGLISGTDTGEVRFQLHSYNVSMSISNN